MSYIGHKNKTRFRRDYIKPLVDKGLLKMTIPEKPTSKYQKYISKWKIYLFFLIKYD